MGEAAGEEQVGIRAAIFEGRDAGGEAVAELVVELILDGGVGERGYEALHGGQLFIEAAEYRGSIDEYEREAIGVGAGDEDEEELGRDEFADLGFLGLERLNGEAGLRGGGVDGSFGGEIVGEDQVGGLAGFVEADEAVVVVGADDAGLGEFQALKTLGIVGGDTRRGEG